MNRELDLAYIAGLFDGEGSIVITTRDKKKRLILTVVLVNTDITVVDMVHSYFGYGVRAVRSRNGSLGKKPCYVVQWTSSSAAKVLTALLPYLRIKKARAEIALRFQATMRRCGVKGVSSVVLNERARLREEIKLH